MRSKIESIICSKVKSLGLEFYPVKVELLSITLATGTHVCWRCEGEKTFRYLKHYSCKDWNQQLHQWNSNTDNDLNNQLKGGLE